MYKLARHTLIYNSRHCSTTKDVNATLPSLGNICDQRRILGGAQARPFLFIDGMELNQRLGHEVANQQLHASDTSQRMGVKGEIGKIMSTFGCLLHNTLPIAT